MVENTELIYLGPDLFAVRADRCTHGRRHEGQRGAAGQQAEDQARQ